MQALLLPVIRSAPIRILALEFFLRDQEEVRYPNMALYPEHIKSPETERSTPVEAHHTAQALMYVLRTSCVYLEQMKGQS